MDGLPEVLLTDENKHIVKYSIETITYRESQCNKSFFRVKVGDMYYDVSEGTSSFEKLRDLLTKKNSEDLLELKG